MTVIYNNIPAVNAAVVNHILSGCENQILFRANDWGALPTIVVVESYSVSDPNSKTWQLIQASSDFNFCIPCASKGEAYRFRVLQADPATTELFVEILEPGCCCPPASGECFDIPIRFTPCQ